MVRAKLYRIQDRDGRGPWRPGFSQVWSDPDGPAHLPPVYEDFPHFPRLIYSAHCSGMHIGCCVRGIDGLLKWFTAKEREALASLGYRIVNGTQGQVLAESEHQVVVAFRKPLKQLPRVPWTTLTATGRRA